MARRCSGCALVILVAGLGLAITIVEGTSNKEGDIDEFPISGLVIKSGMSDGLTVCDPSIDVIH